LSLAFIFSQVLIFPFPCLTRLVSKLVHHKDAYFLNFNATITTFCSSGMSLYSKILSTVCIHSKKSFGSNLPSNSGISTLKSVVDCLPPRLGRLRTSSSLGDPSERDSSLSSSAWIERDEEALRIALLLHLIESWSCFCRYSFWASFSSF